MRKVWRVACFVGRLLFVVRDLWRGRVDRAHDRLEGFRRKARPAG